MSGFFVRWASQFKLLVLAVAAGVVALGISSLPQAPTDALPEFAAPHVEIQTEALGLSAVEVEQLITSPMEADILNGVAYLDEMRSESVAGLSSIQLVFEPGTDLLRARQLVAERLTLTRDLPKVSTAPVLMQPRASASRVMMVRMSSADHSLIDMSVLARWTIKPRLMGVPGVANVSIWGQREQQMQVQVDHEVLRASGVTLNDVIETTGNAVWVSPLSFLEASTPGTGGFLETANQRLGIQHVLPITSPRDLSQVSLESDAGAQLALGDVTTVVEHHQPLIGDAVALDDPGLLLVVEKFPGANTVEVSAALEDALEGLKPGLSGVEIDTSVYRPASFIESAVNDLGIAVLVSLLLALALLALFTRSWRITLIGIVVIVVSASAAALVIVAVGGVLNVVVFAGLAVALSVVAGDLVSDLHALRRMRQSFPPDAERTPDIAQLMAASLRQTRGPVGFAALVMALAAAPVLLLTGVDRAFLGSLALAYLLAIGVSLLVAWLLIPALGTLLLTKDSVKRSTPRLASQTSDVHGRALEWSSGRTLPVIAAAAAVVIAGAFVAPLVAANAPAAPALQNRTILIQWDGHAGTSLEEMSRVTANVSSELRDLPGVAAVGGHAGRAITSDQVVGVNSAELWVTVDENSDYAVVADAVRSVADGYPGMRSDIGGYAEERITAERSRVPSDFVVRVYGVDMDVLRDRAEEVRTMLEGTDGLSAARLDLPADQPIAEIEVDLAAARNAVIKPGDVRRAAAALLQGIEVGYLFEQQKVFQVIVVGDPAARHSLTSVENLLIDTPNGTHVRLGDIAEVRVVPNQTVVEHVDTSRYIDVLATRDGRSSSDVAADVRAGLADIEFPLEYHAQIPSAVTAQDEGQQWTWLVGLVVALGILVLFQTAVASWRVAAVMLLALALPLAGGALGSLLAGGMGSQITLVGFAAILGIATRDSILLVRTAQIKQISALQAARERLFPTLGTSLMTALLLAPLVVLGGAVGREVLLPIMLVVWGGLLASALMTLLVLPAVLNKFGIEGRDDAMEPQRFSGTPARVDGWD
ncbi:MAG TPA: efflux RND transporter permease subunit [Glaciibacter sp.]|nr:efflux RND transporter permease subunit [Glaciibacter sp.]